MFLMTIFFVFFINRKHHPGQGLFIDSLYPRKKSVFGFRNRSYTNQHVQPHTCFFFLYPATLKSAGYYVIPSVQKFAFEYPSVCLSVRLYVRPSALCFNSLPGAFFNQFSSNLVQELTRKEGEITLNELTTVVGVDFLI